jgi:hypothetical protein
MIEIMNIIKNFQGLVMDIPVYMVEERVPNRICGSWDCKVPTTTSKAK